MVQKITPIQPRGVIGAPPTMYFQKMQFFVPSISSEVLALKNVISDYSIKLGMEVSLETSMN